MSRSKLKSTDVPSALKSIDVKAVLRRRGIYLKKRQNAEFKEQALPIARKLVQKKQQVKAIVEVKPPQKYMSFADDVVQSYKAMQIHNAEVLENHFNEALNKFLINKVLAKAIDNLNSLNTEKAMKAFKAPKAKKMIFDADDKSALINQARIDLTPYLQNMAVISGQEANGLLPVDDPYVPSEALRKRIDGNVSKFTESMVDTDQEHLSNLIVAGIEDGKGVPEIASSIKSDFGDYSKNQATLITRTEVLRSSNQAAVDAFKQSGVVEGKQWIIAGAEDECADFDGEVVTLDSGFYSDTNDFQDGDPPLHPNCKCIVIPVLSSNDDQKLAIAENQKTAMKTHIKDLESQIDKRKKDFKDLKKEHVEQRADDKAYIRSLEKYLGVADESQ